MCYKRHSAHQRTTVQLNRLSNNFDSMGTGSTEGSMKPPNLWCGVCCIMHMPKPPTLRILKPRLIHSTGRTSIPLSAMPRRPACTLAEYALDIQCGMPTQSCMFLAC